MRIAAATAMFVVISAAGASADPPPSPPAPAADRLLGYYPPAARAAGVSGEATLGCGRSEHGALVNCTLTSESPPGYGFGAAALALAAASVGNPVGHYGESAAHLALPTAFHFTADPPAITPDVFSPHFGVPTIIQRPQWAKVSSSISFAKFYPKAAARAHIHGHVDLLCVVEIDGTADCQVTSEDPPGLGFGDAALKISRLFRFVPMQRDGVPVAGGKVNIPIGFTPP
jgi:TonB family protein